jgi:hypothetical protein
LPLSLSIITRCMVPTCSPFERYTGVFSTLSLAMSEEVSRTFVGCVVTAIVFLRCFAENRNRMRCRKDNAGTATAVAFLKMWEHRCCYFRKSFD